MSTFQKLAAICRDERNYSAFFSDFKLIAILLHGERNDSMCRAVRRSFDALDRATGSGLAVLTFVDPPRGWKEAHGQFMSTIESVAPIGNCEDKDFTEALRRRLGLESLPCLLLSGSLLSDRFLSVSPDSGDPVGQLSAIGAYLDAAGDGFSIEAPGFHAMLGRFGTVSDHSTGNGNSIAENIADLVAVKSIDGSGHAGDSFCKNMQKQEAMQWTRMALARKKSGFENAAGEDAERKMEEYSEYLGMVARMKNSQAGTRVSSGGYMTYTNHYRSFELNDGPGMGFLIAGNSNTCTDRTDLLVDLNDFRYAEHESVYQLLRYNEFIKARKNGPTWMESSGDLSWLDESFLRNDEFDCEAVCLGKAYEEEINASVVQLIRREAFDIPMPEFYRKHCPGKNTCKANLATFNFKDRKSGGLRGIPTGQVINAIQTLCREKSGFGDCLGQFCSPDFMHDSETIYFWRDRASHAGTHVAEKDFRRMHDAFKGVMGRYLQDMVLMKQKLAGQV